MQRCASTCGPRCTSTSPGRTPGSRTASRASVSFVARRRREEPARHRPARTAVALRAAAVGEQLATTRDRVGVDRPASPSTGCDRLHEVVDVVPVLVTARRDRRVVRELLERLLEAADRDVGLSGTCVSLSSWLQSASVARGRDRAEAAGDVARVALEVVVLVEDAGPVEDALLLRAGAVRERAVLRRRSGAGPLANTHVMLSVRPSGWHEPHDDQPSPPFAPLPTVADQRPRPVK